MAKNMHEENKSAKKVSVVPCILMIVFLPFILLYFLFTLLFVPIDYLIFKRSLYHRDFGGRYSFLSGAHPDNLLYTVIKRNGLPILYAKGSCAYEAEGVFFYKNLLITAHSDVLYADGEWRVHTDGGDIPLELAERAMLDSAAALPGVRCERAVFLVRSRVARRAHAEADERIVLFEKRTLAAALREIIAKENG